MKRHSEFQLKLLNVMFNSCNIYIIYILNKRNTCMLGSMYDWEDITSRLRATLLQCSCALNVPDHV